MRTVNEWFKQFNDGPEASRYAAISRRELSKVQVDAIRHCINVFANNPPVNVMQLLHNSADEIEHENDKL